MQRLLAAVTVLTLLLFPAASNAEEVGTSAKACIIIDEVSGRTLLSHQADIPLPMASTTKIMTALLAIENCKLDEIVRCSRNAFGVPGTSIYLSEGEALTMRDMLYGLMLASGNDAATAIAEHIGGSVENFCRMMTDRAAALGCDQTVFLTPHGLPQDGHYTTASDLAKIAREAMKHPVFREIVSTSRATIPWEGRPYDRVLNNKNRLLTTYEGATGIKTGYTKKAGRCLVFGADRNGMKLIGVVLNCADWFSEAERLMNNAFDRYEACTMMKAGDRVGDVQIHGGEIEQISAELQHDLTAVIPKGTIPQIEIELPDVIEAPVTNGQPIGIAQLISGGVVAAEVQLTAGQSAERDDFPARWLQYWQQWFAFR